MKYTLALLLAMFGVSAQAAPRFGEAGLQKSEAAAPALAQRVWYRGWFGGGYYRPPYYGGYYRPPYYGGYYRPYRPYYYPSYGYGSPYYPPYSGYPSYGPYPSYGSDCCGSGCCGGWPY